MLSMNEHIKGQLAVFLCAVLWSTSGLFIKLVDWHPIVIAGIRSLIAAIFMLSLRAERLRGTGGRKKGVTVGVTGGITGGITGGESGRPARKISGWIPRNLYTWAAGIAYGATMILFVIANKLTASANAILLQYSAPVWAAILGWLIVKEKPRAEHWGALVAVIAGLIIFFKDGLAAGSFAGDTIAVISGITFGANSVFMRMQKDGDPSDSMLIAHFLTALFSIPFILMYPPAISAGSVLAISFMGIFQIGAASLLFSYGIRRISAIQAMLTAVIEPVLNPVWVLLVTGERPALSALIGGGIIVSAVLISSLAGKRRDG